jgi:hypothetical protein
MLERETGFAGPRFSLDTPVSAHEQTATADKIEKLVEAKVQGMEARLMKELGTIRDAVRSESQKSVEGEMNEETS